jgi:Ca-activated chloride channel family protein
MSSQTTEPDPYAVLGLSANTPFPEVRAAHRRLILELHPDVNPAARERFDAVQAAFAVLRRQQDHARAHSGNRHTSSRIGAVPRDTEAGGVAPLEQRADPKEGTTRLDDDETRTEGDQFGGNLSWSAVGTTIGAEGAGQTGSMVERVLRIRPDSTPPEGSALQVVLTPGRESLLLQPRAQMLYVLLDLKLSQEIRAGGQPLNLSLVLDHSSSMQREDKLQRLKEAVSRIIDMMQPQDYLSIVTFGDRATVLLPSSPLGDKRPAKEALDAIRCRGGTEMSTGIRAGLQELQTHSANLLSQMLVLTDGQTYGDEAICLALASQAAERQVQVTALGLGDDWNSVLLDELALRTGGQSDYVQSAAQLSRVFEEQLRTLQLTAVRNLTLSVGTAMNSRLLRATWVAPSIKMLPVPADTMPGDQDIELQLGRVSTDREYRLLLELVVAARSVGHIDVASLAFTYEVPGLDRERESISRLFGTAFVEKWEIEPPVHQRVHDALRKITAHRLQEQAMQAIQDGETQKGTASLRTAAGHLEAAGSSNLAALARAEADRIERHGQARAGNMKRIIYGTRSLG